MEPTNSKLTDREIYEFDLTGYLVFKNVLTLEQVKQMNKAIDDYQQGEFYFEFPMWPLLEKDPIFLDLLTLPKVMDVCEEFLGLEFRIDNIWGVQEVPPFVGARNPDNLHGGQMENKRSYQYVWHGNKAYCGQLNFGFALENAPEGDGGFVVVPGSHNQNMAISGVGVFKKILNKTMEDVRWIQNPGLEAGDMIVFTEALVHGSKAWIHKDKPRRNIYYRYSPGCMIWRDYKQIERYASLARNDLEKNLLRAPYVGQPDDIHERPLWDNRLRTRTRPSPGESANPTLFDKIKNFIR